MSGTEAKFQSKRAGFQFRSHSATVAVVITFVRTMFFMGREDLTTRQCEDEVTEGQAARHDRTWDKWQHVG